MRPGGLAFLLAIPLMAGCLAGPAPAVQPPAQADAPAQVPLVWDLTDCEAMSWEVPVPASRLAARLPDGFAPSAAAPTPPGVEPMGVLGFEAVECAAGFGSTQSVARSVPFARIYTPVVPPSEDTDPRAGARHAFVWSAAVSDGDWRARLAGAGLPVLDGGTLVGPVAQGYAGRLALDGLGAFAITGRPDGAQPQPNQPMRDFTPATGGLAAWVGTLEQLTAANGVGVWEATAGSWVADVLGATNGVAPFRLERYTIPHEAVIRPDADGAGEPFMGGPVDEPGSFSDSQPSPKGI